MISPLLPRDRAVHIDMAAQSLIASLPTPLVAIQTWRLQTWLLSNGYTIHRTTDGSWYATNPDRRFR